MERSGRAQQGLFAMVGWALLLLLFLGKGYRRHFTKCSSRVRVFIASLSASLLLYINAGVENRGLPFLSLFLSFSLSFLFD